MPSRFTAVAVLALSVAPALADGTHTAEIEAFASAMAIARTVRDCPGTTPDDAYLEALRVTCTSSRPALLLGYMQQAEVLQQGLADAPCRQAWCNAVFRLYEPKA